MSPARDLLESVTLELYAPSFRKLLIKQALTLKGPSLCLIFSHPKKELIILVPVFCLYDTSSPVQQGPHGNVDLSARRSSHVGPCSKLCQSSNFTSAGPSSYIHIPSKMHIFLAKSSAISPLNGISILGQVPSLCGDLSASRLSTGVGTFVRQSRAFGTSTSKKQFGSKNFPEVLPSQG